jgi:hypothetical protein
VSALPDGPPALIGGTSGGYLPPAPGASYFQPMPATATTVAERLLPVPHLASALPPSRQDKPLADEPEPGKWSRKSIITGAVIVALLAATTLGWAVAKQQSSLASSWQHRDIAENAQNLALSGTLSQARTSITTLNGRVTSLGSQIVTLNGDVSSLQGQLAATADQKEKALDQNAVLTQLVSAASTVSASLASCVTDTDSFETQLDDDLADGTIVDDPTLMTNASAVGTECGAAEAANQQLQPLLVAPTS